MSRVASPIYLAALTLTLLSGLLIGCDSSFDPLQENNVVFFSIFGFLDASADTQWVRITPVKETIWLDPEQYDIEVTLENMGTGDIFQMQDSLFYYGNDVAYAYNFWSIEELEPEATYKVTAVQSDGKTSSVTMTLPPDFPTPVYTSGVLEVENVENLADVKVLYHFRSERTGNIRVYPLPKLYEAHRTFNGNIRVFLGDRRQDQEYRVSNFPAEGWQQVKREIYVAAAGPGWPDFVSSDDLASTISDYQTNVEGGVGFVGGVVSKTVPFESCRDDDGNLIGCPLVE